MNVADPSNLATLLAEFPFRCLALNAQVTAGLWRRNGISIQGQAMHYSTAPFCKVFRDLDLTAVQYATILGGNELVLGLLLDRFLLSRWAVEPHLVPSGPFEPKDFVVLAEEALHVLILLVTELPGPPSKYVSIDLYMYICMCERNSYLRHAMHERSNIFFIFCICISIHTYRS